MSDATPRTVTVRMTEGEYRSLRNIALELSVQEGLQISLNEVMRRLVRQGKAEAIEQRRKKK